MFDRSWTVTLPGGGGPAVFTLENVTMPDETATAELAAWTGAASVANVYIFEGDITLADCQNRIARVGGVDALLTVPHGGVGKVRIPGNIERRLTVFFDQADANAQAVTLRIREMTVHAS